MAKPTLADKIVDLRKWVLLKPPARFGAQQAAHILDEIADSHAALLAALKRLLDSTPYVSDVDECECGEGEEGACEHIQAHRALAQARGT